jgi:hypothetical protein
MTLAELDPSSPGVLRTLADVTPERVRWLWPGRLPAGKLVVLDGDPSTGKSTLSLDLAARVSTGTAWPDGTECPAGDVLLLSAEDGLADTIAPRLTAAGAGLDHVHALTDVRLTDEGGTVRKAPPSLPRDLHVVEHVVTTHRVRLVIVDVLMAFLSGKVDSHRDQDVRGVLHQLAALAEKTGATIVLIRHLNKSGGGAALYRGGGSIGIIGAARAAFLVARDPDDEQRRIFAVTKSNLAVEPPALAYRLVDDPDNGCARVEWEDQPTEHKAADLLGAPSDGDDGAQSEAVAWLINYLTDNGGQAPAGDLIKAAAKDGIAKRTVQRARKKAGVDSRKNGFGGDWVWSLEPEGATKGAVDASSQGLAPLSPSVAPMADPHRETGQVITFPSKPEEDSA